MIGEPHSNCWKGCYACPDSLGHAVVSINEIEAPWRDFSENNRPYEIGTRDMILVEGTVIETYKGRDSGDFDGKFIGITCDQFFKSRYVEFEYTVREQLITLAYREWLKSLTGLLLGICALVVHQSASHGSKFLLRSEETSEQAVVHSNDGQGFPMRRLCFTTPWVVVLC